jgi:hypothetical protein
LKRKRERAVGEDDLESGDGSDESESPEFDGLADSDAEEKMFSKYDEFVGGSSDSDDDSDEEGGDDDEGGDLLADSRSNSIRKFVPDDISLSSEASDSEDSDFEDDTLAPPSKKAKTRAREPVSFNAGNSTFLPTLMGGYISGSESASDVDVAPPTRKNRRGQRARQAIWDKKYGEKANHHEVQKEKDARNAGWDMKRGAVDGDTSKPWKQGIRNPFEKNQVHPDRQRLQGGGSGDRQGRGLRDNQEDKATKPRPPPTRDDTGSLHASWAAAKAAKEEAKKVEFQGKKVVFD